MRVVHVPFGWWPGPTGGTEVYVAALAEAQRRLGIDAAVVAPADTTLPGSGEHPPASRFLVTPPHVFDAVYGDGEDDLVDAFWRAAGPQHVDVLHLHAHTRAVSARLARSARSRGARVVATYHTASISCLQGLMLRFGRVPCSGDVASEPCVACCLSAKGLPPPWARPVAAAVALLPSAVRGLFAGRMRTLVSMPGLARRRASAFAAFDAALDAWVAPSRWVVELLVRNGVAPPRILWCPQGVSHRRSRSALAPRGDGPLRIAFVGRLAPEKGLEVLLAALRGLPPGTVQAVAYLMGEAASAPAGIDVRFGIDGVRLLDELAGYDLLCVPSQWMETGPLVVLEAFEAGVPVLGSALGGIAERVRDGVDGLLVREWWSPEAWAAALSALACDPGALVRLRSGVRPPRDMGNVADEMANLYSRLVVGDAAPADRRVDGG
jgi:glycosyltransferase involved in cell wall biosynthesis